jgi:hypothetical protein
VWAFYNSCANCKWHHPDAYSLYITFDIISSRHFFTIWHYIPFGVNYILHYFQLTFSTFCHFVPFGVITFVLMSFRHYLPFNILSFQRFWLFNVFSINLLSHLTFCLLTFFTIGIFYFEILSVNQLRHHWEAATWANHLQVAAWICIVWCGRLLCNCFYVQVS